MLCYIVQKPRQFAMKNMPAVADANATLHQKATLARWPGLTRFLEDGRLELDTNPVENQIKKIALTRINALFAGHEVGAENCALLASMIANCKLRDVDPVG